MTYLLTKTTCHFYLGEIATAQIFYLPAGTLVVGELDTGFDGCVIYMNAHVAARPELWRGAMDRRTEVTPLSALELLAMEAA